MKLKKQLEHNTAIMMWSSDVTPILKNVFELVGIEYRVDEPLSKYDKDVVRKGDIPEDTDNDIESLTVKLKQNKISDEEIIVLGRKLIENSIKTNTINDILEFSEYLNIFINKHSIWSPYKSQLNNLSYNIEELLENQNIINIQLKYCSSYYCIFSLRSGFWRN